MPNSRLPFTPKHLFWVLAWVACVLFGALITMAIKWPAHWLGRYIEHATDHRLLWHSVSGSLWQGQANLALSSPPSSEPPLRLPGIWRWKATWQWQQGPVLQVHIVNSEILQNPLIWRWRPFHLSQPWSLSSSQWRFQAGWLQALGAPWNTLDIHATLRLQTTEWQGQLNWRGARATQGQAKLQIDELSSALVPLRPLGNYHVAMSLEGRPHFVLSTESGSLKLQGQGNWEGQRLRFQGWARAEEAQLSLLQPLLGALGQRQGQQASLNW